MRLLIALLIFAITLFLIHYIQILFPLKYYEEAFFYGKKYNFDPLLVLALIKVESSFDPNAVSPAGAVGLLQIMPHTLKWLEEKFSIYGDLTDPASSLEIGLFYLRYLVERYGNLDDALKAYNVGPHAHESGSKEDAAKRYLKKTKWAYLIYRILYRPPR